MLYSIFVVNHDQTKTPVATKCSIMNTDGSLNLSPVSFQLSAL